MLSECVPADRTFTQQSGAACGCVGDTDGATVVLYSLKMDKLGPKYVGVYGLI